MADFPGIDMPVSIAFGSFDEPSGFDMPVQIYYGGGSEAPDTQDPAVTLISPLSGKLERTQPIQVLVDDNEGLSLIVLMAEFTDGTYEVVHDGSKFAPFYITNSTVVPGGANGSLYTLRRAGLGWPGSFVFRARAIDTSGNPD